MGRNDPDNLRRNGFGDAILACDFCKCRFTLDRTEALKKLRRNQDGRIFCTQSCATRASNAKRREAPKKRPHAAHVCPLRPQGDVCPLIGTPPLMPDGPGEHKRFTPQTDTEIDMTIEYLRAVAELKRTAPPDNDEAADRRTEQDRISWERADATHSVLTHLLAREVSRRT